MMSPTVSDKELSSQLTDLLDDSLRDLLREDVVEVFRRFVPKLDECLDRYCEADSLDEFKRICRLHPIWEKLQEDPYTARAHSKPRGYAGDAVMLDYVYTQSCPEGSSHLGRAVFRATTGLSIGQSVRNRKRELTRRIAERLDADPSSKFASIACGHLREVSAIDFGKDYRFSSFLAVDIDETSLTEVENCLGANGITTLTLSVSRLMQRCGNYIPPSDLIYSAGLYDYLSDRFAERLTLSLWDCVNAGGELLIANFAPNTFGRGYLSGVMDWDLIYRGEAQIEALAKKIEGVKTTFRDKEGNLVFLSIRKV